MKLLLILFLQIGCFSAAQPNWIGTFVVDKTCDPKKCCCFDGRITIEGKYPTTLTLTAGVTGAALYCGTAHTLTFPRPQTSSTMIVSDGDKFYFQLNSDGTRLSITYDQEDSMKCFGNAVKLNR